VIITMFIQIPVCLTLTVLSFLD